MLLLNKQVSNTDKCQLIESMMKVGILVMICKVYVRKWFWTEQIQFLIFVQKKNFLNKKIIILVWNILYLRKNKNYFTCLKNQIPWNEKMSYACPKQTKFLQKFSVFYPEEKLTSFDRKKIIYKLSKIWAHKL